MSRTDEAGPIQVRRMHSQPVSDRYIICSAYTTSELAQFVSHKMSKGYVPVGGVAIEPNEGEGFLRRTIYHQALVLAPTARYEIKADGADVVDSYIRTMELG